LSRAALVLILSLAIAGCGDAATNIRAPIELHVNSSIPTRTGTAPEGETQSGPLPLGVTRAVQVACGHLGRLPTAADAASPTAQVHVLEKELTRLPTFGRELLALRLPKGHDAETRAVLATLRERLRTYEHYLSSVIALDKRIVSDFKITGESPNLAIGMMAHGKNAQRRSSLAHDLKKLIGPSCLDRLSSE
jgi:hypothetical protein